MKMKMKKECSVFLSCKCWHIHFQLCALKREWRLTPNNKPNSLIGLTCSDDSEEVRKIKKVQSFFRGWLCRRRWKQIVIEYINSPHAENMRKRNRFVWRPNGRRACMLARSFFLTFFIILVPIYLAIYLTLPLFTTHTYTPVWSSAWSKLKRNIWNNCN